MTVSDRRAGMAARGWSSVKRSLSVRALLTRAMSQRALVGALVLGGAVAAFSAAPVLAQSGPVRLLPQGSNGNGGNGFGGGGALPSFRQAPAPAPAPPIVGSGRMGPGGIEVHDLGAINPDGYGLIDTRSGGLAADMWQGTDMGTAVALLTKAPVEAPSRAMAALLRRVLLTTATPPAGRAGALMPARVESMFAQGRPDDVIAMVERLPDDGVTDDLRRRRVEALLLERALDKACAETQDAVRDSEAAFWLEASIFCQIRDGKTEAASMGMAMLRETGDSKESFLMLAERMGGLSNTAPKTMTSPDPLTVALYREAGLPFPSDVMATPTPWLTRGVSLSAPADPAQRLDAGERAEAVGALPTEALRFMMGDMPIPAQKLSQPIDVALGSISPTGRATAYQIVQGTSEPGKRGRLAASLLRSVSLTPALYGPMARVLVPALRDVPPSAVEAGVAMDLARALFAAGEIRNGVAWVDALRRAGGIPAGGMDRLEALVRAQDDPMEALPVPTAADVGYGGAVGGHGGLEALGLAAGRQSVAETALRALQVLGPNGPGAASPITLRTVVEALVSVGLVADARAIATEALALRP